MAIRAHSKGLELACHVKKDVPLFLIGDPHRLRQIITNLVGNAIKFTEKYDTTINVLRKYRPLLDKNIVNENSSFKKQDLVAGKPENTDILLVENDKINQKLVVMILTRNGFNVTIANNGEEAVALLDNGKFDLVLMDINMPKMDGFQATKIIRDKKKYSNEHIPMIALTALAFKEDKDRSLDAGLDTYVSKPTRSNE